MHRTLDRNAVGLNLMERRGKMRRIRKGWNIFQDIEITLAVLMAFAVILPMCFGIVPYGVMSGSMEPRIGTGAVCYVDTKTEDYHTGDIITFRTGGKTVTHRIIGKSGNAFMTKGDANRVSDPWTVGADQIIGKARLWIPKMGYLIKNLQTRAGMFAIGAVLSANLFISLLLKTDKEEKEAESASSNGTENKKSQTMQ
jgi:signal peptidase